MPVKALQYFGTKFSVGKKDWTEFLGGEKRPTEKKQKVFQPRAPVMKKKIQVEQVHPHSCFIFQSLPGLAKF